MDSMAADVDMIESPGSSMKVYVIKYNQMLGDD
jgi:hypothetical protein